MLPDVTVTSARHEEPSGAGQPLRLSETVTGAMARLNDNAGAGAQAPDIRTSGGVHVGCVPPPGGPGDVTGAATLTTTLAEAFPPAPLQTSVYDVVDVKGGVVAKPETVRTSLVGHPAAAVHVVAPVDTHDRIAAAPGCTVAGLADRFMVGAGGGGGGGAVGALEGAEDIGGGSCAHVPSVWPPPVPV